MAGQLVRPSSPSYTQPSPLVSIITPSDAADLAYASREIWIRGAGGNITVEFEPVPGGARVTTTFAVLLGDKLPWVVHRIRATGTTATGIWVNF